MIRFGDSNPTFIQPPPPPILFSKTSTMEPQIINFPSQNEPTVIQQSKPNLESKPFGIIHAKVRTLKQNNDSRTSTIKNQQPSSFSIYPVNRVVAKVNLKHSNSDQSGFPSKQNRQPPQQGKMVGMPFTTATILPVLPTDGFHPVMINHNNNTISVLPTNQTNSTLIHRQDGESNIAPVYRQITQNTKSTQKYCFGLFQCSRPCILGAIIFACLLVSIDVSIVLVSLLIKSKTSTSLSTASTTSTVGSTSTTTITTATTATTTPTTVAATASCSISSNAVLNRTLKGGSASTSWMSVSYNFTAASANSTLIVIISATNSDGWLLDDFSVKDFAGNETLINGNFENSTITNGWLSNRCTGVTCASITNSGCSGGSNGCFEVTCNTDHALQQTFFTIAATDYTFSFKMKVMGSTTNSISISYSIA